MDVAAALTLVFVSGDLTGAVAVLAMDAPAAAVRDAANLLHIDVDHVPGAASGYFLLFSVALAVGVDEPAAVQPERDQVPRYRAATERDTFGLELNAIRAADHL
ncbi:hypothetical protein Scani_32740 [Streptomyces caniferus]|uniref:Uncharacterized protein n=1 Tax=Streptomyces caniferus TaxID=285557 RepID=A0A640S9B4_9ACTN|nr:hypothetical protein Scani_32740 [Streptomyces caniferus]